ncbi:MAG: threonine synthase, partial [Candidatus Omnitrophica bacterium]|nr:threonine synthase [Candidatus Omnitrophota bacterium]
KLLANEGVFVEPASAASVAGLIKLNQKGFFKGASAKVRIACILTGHGLKDPDRAIKSIKNPKVVKPTTEAILKEII